MKKYLYALPILVLSALVLTGCEKDAEYYSKHPDEAVAKMKQCTESAKKAMNTLDMKAMEKLSKDKECAAVMQIAVKGNSLF